MLCFFVDQVVGKVISRYYSRGHSNSGSGIGSGSGDARVIITIFGLKTLIKTTAFP